MEEVNDVKSVSNVVPFKTLNQKLLNIQTELVASKGSKNSFGKYSYRNVEDILTEVKPLLAKNGVTMTMCDSLREVNGEVYIEARVVLEDADGKDVDGHDGYPKNVVSSSFAREPKTQGGMSPSQMTGTASSYARKYALGALFLISGEACPDYASEVQGKLDSLKTLQDRDKVKDKDKGKDKVIPKTVKDFGGRMLNSLSLDELKGLSKVCTTDVWQKEIKVRIDFLSK